MAIKFKTLNTGDIAAGASWESEWIPDRDCTIKAVLMVERSEKDLSAVQAYLDFGKEIMTLDYVPASVIGQDLEYCYKPNFFAPKGMRIYTKLTNGRKDTINVDVVYYFEER